MPTPVYPPVYSELCNAYGLQQALILPLDPEPLVFALHPDDIKFNQVDAGKSITVKYATFNRQISAFIPEISITLHGISQETLNTLIDFAIEDFESKVQTTGKGSITVYYKGEVLTDCYIRSPIDAPTSVYTYWEQTPKEIFDTVDFTIISPNSRWY